MKHTDEGVLQALLDGELAPEEAARVEAHLAACGACAAGLDGLRRDRGALSAALAAADVEPRLLAARAAIVRRRPARGGVLGGVRRALPKAAVLVVGVAGAAAAAAVPGSPIRAVVERVIEGPRAREVAPPPPPAPEATSTAAGEAPREAAGAGVSILPEGGSVRVRITGAAPGLRVHVRLTDGGGFVEATAAGARFRNAPGRVEVLGAGTGDVKVDLPRGAVTAFVEVDGRVYVAKAGDQLRARVPAAGGTPDEPVFVVGG